MTGDRTNTAAGEKVASGQAPPTGAHEKVADSVKPVIWLTQLESHMPTFLAAF